MRFSPMMTITCLMGERVCPSAVVNAGKADAVDAPVEAVVPGVPTSPVAELQPTAARDPESNQRPVRMRMVRSFRWRVAERPID